MKSSRLNDPESANGESNGKGEFDSFASQVRNIDLTNTSLESLGESLKNIFDCQAANIFVYDNSRKDLYLKGSQPNNQDEIRLDISFNNLTSYVAATGKPINIKNVHSKEELNRYHEGLKYDSARDANQPFKTQSVMLIPLPHKNRLVGVVEFINKKNGNHFHDYDFVRAKAISLVIGLAVIKIEEREEKNANQQGQIIDLEDKIVTLAKAINDISHPDEIFSKIQQPLLEAFDATDAIIFAVDMDKNEIYSKTQWNEFKQEIRVPIDSSSIAGFVAARDQSLNIADAQNQKELSQHQPDLQVNEPWNKNTGSTTKTLLTIPLNHSFQLLGVLQIIDKKGETGFSPEDEKNALKIAESLAQVFHDQKVFIEPKPTKFSYLIDNGYLTEDELNLTIEKGKKTGLDIEELLINELYLRSIDVGKSLESFYNIPYASYNASLVPLHLEDFDIDAKILRERNWVPLINGDSDIIVLINDPSDKDTVEEIKRTFLQHKIDFRVGLKMDILKYLDTYQESEKMPESIETNILTGDDKLELTLDEESHAIRSEVQDSSSDRSGQLFDEIISIAIGQGVTDIHIEPGMDDKNLLVRLRKEGACRVFEEIPSHFQKDIISHVKKLADLDPSVTKLPQNGKFVWSQGHNKYELSIVVFPTIGDLEDAMIRVTQVGKSVPEFMSMTDMEFSDPNLDKIMSRIHTSKGLILVTGPEGTGKTTSLHALLNHLNTPDKKIVTAENPVEIVQTGLRQLQMNEENGLNYALALETFLLGNPDIILLGEIDKDETLKLCVEAAKQRLVFTSMKGKSTMDAIRKMREMHIDPDLLADAFVLIMAQKLVPSLCDHCKEDYHPSPDEFNMLEKFYGDKNFSELGFQYNDNLTLKKAVGCKQCIFTGYSGEIALQEVLERTPELNRLIAQKAPMEEIHNQALQDGMITLNQDGIYKIMNGDCDFKKIQEAFLPGRF
ncbi:MAG: hypothetical protein NPINA01_13810 [Nitrospinaceae bacterium]|nr:MAG: hypothetical protein NPINA01_13810 [Nitrospinaceae bacterium]